jgi:hypothetical protein
VNIDYEKLFTLHYAYNAFGYESEIDDGTNYAITYWRPVRYRSAEHVQTFDCQAIKHVILLINPSTLRYRAANFEGK